MEQIPRSKNSHADSLATLATSSREKLSIIILMENHATLAYNAQVLMGVHFTGVGPSWMDLVVTFLKHGTLPEEKIEVEKIQRKASRFWLSKDKKLYKC